MRKKPSHEDAAKTLSTLTTELYEAGAMEVDIEVEGAGKVKATFAYPFPESKGAREALRQQRAAADEAERNLPYTP